MFILSFSRRLITDSKVKLKYQHLITNSFVEVSASTFVWVICGVFFFPPASFFFFFLEFT